MEKNRIKVKSDQYKIGDLINGKTITGFGKSWSEYPTDDTACAYGLPPGLDSYPSIRVCYAYFSAPQTKVKSESGRPCRSCGTYCYGDCTVNDTEY